MLISTTGLEGAGEAKQAISTAGKGVGRKSQCEPLAGVIMAKVEVGLSAQRIYQDLADDKFPQLQVELDVHPSSRSQPILLVLPRFPQ
jgi:hypothetical protein